MFGKKLVLVLILLFAFGIAESRIIPKRMTREEFEEYKKQHPEIDWDRVPVDTLIGGKPISGPRFVPKLHPRRWQPALQRDDYWDRVAASRRAQPALRGRPMPVKETEKPMELPIRDALGVPYEGARGQKMSPQMVTDTVRLSAGFGLLDLNAQRGRGRQSVAPSDSNKIYVFGIIPIITDSTQSVPAYGAWINRELDQLNIQSSDASDTRLVQVSFMVQ